MTETPTGVSPTNPSRDARPISPLRRRMLDEMSIRQFSDKTQADYIRHVVTLTRFIGRAPDTATPDDLRAFQVHQRQAGVQPPSMNSSVSALRFFFIFACNRPELGQYLRIVKQPQKLPVVLTQEEAAGLMVAAPGPKFRAIFGVAYGAGLRVSEVAHLKVADIDSDRKLLRVEQGKGRKDRNAMLSPRLIELLREWWLIAWPTTWLFPGRDPIQPVSSRHIYRVVRETAEAIGIEKRVGPHTLRHSFATHLLEQGVDIRVKNYRANGASRYTTMTLDTPEFIRRFLLHVLPKGFHRIRHYGLLATGQRAENIERARELLGAVTTADAQVDAAASDDTVGADLPPCPCCGARQRIIEIFLRGETPKHRATPRPLVFKVDTS